MSVLTRLLETTTDRTVRMELFWILSNILTEPRAPETLFANKGLLQVTIDESCEASDAGLQAAYALANFATMVKDAVIQSDLGGAMALRWGVMRVLMIGAVLSALSNLLFAWLALHGHDVYALIAVVSADNLASGIASAAFIAYLSGLTNVNYSATQYALFSSMMLLLPKFLAGYSGAFVDAYDYPTFFIGTALLGVPVLLLVWLASRHAAPPSATPAAPVEVAR